MEAIPAAGSWGVSESKLLSSQADEQRVRQLLAEVEKERDELQVNLSLAANAGNGAFFMPAKILEGSIAPWVFLLEEAKETPIPPTPIPPTPTLPPTFEPVVQEVVPQQVIVQPQQPQILPAATEEGTKEQDCSKAVIGAGTEGPRAPVSVVNKKGASITLSYYLELSAFGQCGSGSLSINGNGKTLNLPVGCYWLYAWVTYDGKDQSFQGYGCNPKSGAVWTVYPDRVDAVENDK